ncbi:MAG: SBBP repeat-containing protein [Sphingobacteriaceae bacterium]|nr:SBBP repeat-containing protein [Sphingobacteriaceae bacterium]
MKQLKSFILLSFLLGLSFSTSILFADKGNKEQLSGVNEDLNQNDICFTENKGQVYDQNYQPQPDVLYGVMAGNLAVHIKNSGVSYQLYRVDKWKEVEDAKTKQKHKEIDQQTIYRIDLNWLNANTNFTKTEDGTLPGTNNYYLESCPNGALNVKSYTGVTLHNLYNGINLHYYEKQGQLKHDYIVAPHSNYKQIQVKVKGARVQINQDGSLTLTTALGKIQEGAPIVYQNGQQLKSKWIVANSVLSFDIENYNPNYELIIDPVTRLWGTYYGGNVDDYGMSCEADGTGNVYMAGYTVLSTGTIIATSGSHQSTSGGGYEAFLAKFSSAGARQWGTYYGGSGNDQGYSCSIDLTGNVFLTGRTSTNGGTAIASAGAHQTTFEGGTYDAFLVKFDANGIRQWGTYYGTLASNVSDVSYDCSTDASGNVYMTGTTAFQTGTLIATSGAHQSSYGGGNLDAFLVKFNSTGVRQWCTYYGGAGDESSYSCSTDNSGNVYIAGSTNSVTTGTIIATNGSHQSVHAGGSFDAFLVKFDASGVRQWGTYYGGSVIDLGEGCCTDGSGNIYLVGSTDTGTGTDIATSSSHQSIFGGFRDAYLVKFNSSGTRQWGTYYGGGDFEQGWGCSTDVNGNVYLAGNSRLTGGTVIATPGSHQTSPAGINSDAFIAKFDNSGLRQWGTYYGGTSNEEGRSCSIDLTGNVYLTGHTASGTGTVIATSGAHQTSFAGGSFDAFLVKFKDCPSLMPLAVVNSTVCNGTTLNFTTTITGTATPTYSWSGPNTYTSNAQNPIITNASAVNIGVYTVTINNSGCIETTTTQVSVVNPSPTVAVNSGSICNGSSFTITPSGASTYTFSSGSAIVSPTSTSNYTVTGTSAQGCTATAVSSVTVNTCALAQALNFDGVNDIVTIGTGINSIISPTNKITVEAWVKPTTTAGPLRIIVGNYATPAFEMQFCLRQQNNDYTFFVGNGNLGNFTQVFAANTVTTGVWQHVAGTWDGSAVRIYINGVFTNSISATYPNFGTSTNSVVIGSNVGPEPWSGDIDEVRIWNRTLCAAEIVNNMNGEIPTNSTGLLANYHFNQGVAGQLNPTVTTLTDATSNAFNGTLTNFTLNGATSNWTLPGSVTTSVTPYISPIVTVSGTSTVCSGSSAVLTASGNVTSYNWISGPTTSVNVVTPTVTTSYSVYGTNLGCPSNTAIITVTTVSLPTVAVNSGSICNGNSFTITPSGASTYTIQGGNSVVSPTAAASYTVRGTSVVGCVSANTATSNITVSPLPTVVAVTANSIICGPPYQGTAALNASGATTYTWNTSATGNSVAVTPSTTTSYTVTGTDLNGCVNTAVVTQSVSACTGLGESGVEGLEFGVFPNPSTGIYNLVFGEEINIEVIDALGKVILNEKIASGQYVLNLSHYSQGIYFLQARTNSQTKSIKLIKQ